MNNSFYESSNQVYFSWNREKTHGLFHDTQLHVFMFLGYLGDVNFNNIININIDYKI